MHQIALNDKLLKKTKEKIIFENLKYKKIEKIQKITNSNFKKRI